jgi:uncharacterized protein
MNLREQMIELNAKFADIDATSLSCQTGCVTFMLNIPQLLSTELKLDPQHIANALALHAEGGTVPFIARYRKERTGEMNEVVLRKLFDRFAYLTELENRKATVLKTIAEQGKLTDELKAKIEACLEKTALEDVYLPYKPKKRTRATDAKEKGLTPLAEFIKSLNVPESPSAVLEEEAAKYVSEEKKVANIEEALAGASDILAEEVAERADLRSHLRDYFVREGVFVSKINDKHPPGSTKYEMYRDYSVKVKEIHPHNILALHRAKKEGVLTFELQFDDAKVLSYLESEVIRTGAPHVAAFYKTMVRDAFDRLMKGSLQNDVLAEKKLYADQESIKTFEANVRDLLLASPAGMKPTMGIDPGIRTGCKVSIIDETGKFLHFETLHLKTEKQKAQAGELVRNLISQYHIEMIAIGNGTAGRETDEFITQAIAHLDPKPIKVMVSEAGASVYSASHVAREEFPKLDVTVRGAISIGRRLQDPLSELVKIDPKAIGVGQYQHDVDQKLLKKKLEETVESCVNYVGVEVNLASVELLKYVAGLNKAAAKNIVKYREDHGAFRNRAQLKEVPQLGPKAFEQAAGFLRIRGGDNPLDNSAVHPESYAVALQLLNDAGVAIDQAPHAADKLKALDLKKYVNETIGEPTLRDIIAELQKPGRDPRAEFKYATFDAAIKDLKDLKPGMQLEGIVTNVANFGAFVNIGLHQDGLVHISQLANRYVDDPHKVVKVGQIVNVRVLEVNETLKRIALTMKTPEVAQAPKQKVEKRDAGKRPEGKTRKQEFRKARPPQQPQPKKAEGPKETEKHYSLEDLKAKFNAR